MSETYKIYEEKGILDGRGNIVYCCLCERAAKILVDEPNMPLCKACGAAWCIGYNTAMHGMTPQPTHRLCGKNCKHKHGNPLQLKERLFPLLEKYDEKK